MPSRGGEIARLVGYDLDATPPPPPR